MTSWWEPVLQAPHPSTVSDLSENSQKILAALQRNEEVTHQFRNKPTFAGPLVARTPVSKHTPNHYQQRSTASFGALPPTIPYSQSVYDGSRSQSSSCLLPPSQVNRPQHHQATSRGEAWQNVPYFQKPATAFTQPYCGPNVSRQSATFHETPQSHDSETHQRSCYQSCHLPATAVTFKPLNALPSQLSILSNQARGRFIETSKNPEQEQWPNLSQVAPVEHWSSQISPGLPLSASTILSSQVAQQISQITSLREKSPVMEFGSDDEGKDLTQSLTQILQQGEQQLDQRPQITNMTSASRMPNIEQDNVLDLLQDCKTEISLNSPELDVESQKDSAMDIDDEVMQHSSPISQTLSIPEIHNKLSSPFETMHPKEVVDGAKDNEFDLSPVTPTASPTQMTSNKISVSPKIIQKQSHCFNFKKKTDHHNKKDFSVGVKGPVAQFKSKCHGNVSEAKVKLIESVLKPKSSPEQFLGSNKNNDREVIKNTTKEELAQNTAQTSALKKKRRFQAPFKCPLTPPSVKTVNKGENLTIITLTYEETKKLNKQIQSKPPVETCISVMYKEGVCQLSKTAGDTKRNTLCSPIGLMLAILGENDPIAFYFLPLDVNKKDATIFLAEKSLIQNLLLAPCRKVCFKSQELFVYLMHIFNFKYQEVSLKWIAIDPLIGCWLLNPDEPPIYFNQVLKHLGMEGKKQEFHSKAQVQTCSHLVMLSQAAEIMYKKLTDRELWRVFLDLESKITSVLAVMEMEGIPTDKNILNEIGSSLESQIKILQSQANIVMGVPVVLTSPQQLRKILYDQLKLDSKIKIPMTIQGGGKSTSESVLKLLEPLHPLPSIILEFRHLQKLKSTYIDGILQFVSSGKLYTTWEQIAAATGRVISRDPNVQAIPKQLVSIIEGEGMKAHKDIYLRSAFVSKQGYTFLAADFQHIELRLLAHFAQDSALSAMFIQTEQDVFQLLARQWLGLSTSRSVSAEEREHTKRVVYSVMYGAGVKKLEQVLQVDAEEARRILSTFTAKFPQIRNFSKRLIWKARDQGFITSLSGRRRLFPHITSSDMKLRAQSERQAVNFLIQGSAADVCKAAMIATEQAQLEHLPPLNAQLLLQIHDELVWQVPDAQLSQFKEVVQKAMEGTQRQFKISLPLPVALGSGKTWADLQ